MMVALAEQRIFCFEKIVLQLGFVFVALAIFSNQSMSINELSQGNILKGYIQENTILKEQDYALFLLKEKWFEEINKKYGKENIETLEDGIIYTRQYKKINSRNIKINVAEVNRSLNKEIEVIPQINANNIHSRAKINKIAKDSILAINGTYFKQTTGTPLGTLVINNEIISGPIYDRVAFGIGNNHYKTARVSFKGELKTVSRNIKLDNINQPRMLFSHVIVYTPQWGRITPITKSNPINILIVDNKVTTISKKQLYIPQNGIIISGPQDKLEGIKIGDDVVVNYNISPQWENIKHIISGGPYLIKEGEIYIDSKEEKLTSITGRNPRTAIGYTKDNNLILVTVDGRKEGSSGVTLKELAEIMKDYGCYEAINLDGGSSTTMYVKGNVYNGSSLKNPVAINNAILIRNIKV